METEYMLSTFDNPHNPFTDYRAWLAYDEGAGYSTSGLLARIAKASDELSEVDERQANNQAILEILMEDPTGFYIRVTEDYVPKPVKV